jgi:hypothetical protein
LIVDVDGVKRLQRRLPRLDFNNIVAIVRVFRGKLVESIIDATTVVVLVNCGGDCNIANFLPAFLLTHNVT